MYGLGCAFLYPIIKAMGFKKKKNFYKNIKVRKSR